MCGQGASSIRGGSFAYRLRQECRMRSGLAKHAYSISPSWMILPLRNESAFVIIPERRHKSDGSPRKTHRLLLSSFPDPAGMQAGRCKIEEIPTFIGELCLWNSTIVFSVEILVISAFCQSFLSPPNTYFPISSPISIGGSVCVIVPPGSKIGAEPPGSMLTYRSPIRPSVLIDALASP